MAAITKSTSVNIDASSGMYVSTISGKLAGEAIAKGDACYIKGSDGKIYRSINTSANEAAMVHGLAADAAAAGEAVSLYSAGAIWEYSTGMTPGTEVFLGAVAGGLDTAAGTGHPLPVGHVVDAQRIRISVFQ
ncbi:MAG: DUF2190 family protein [Gemmatimonadetes bacterium]|nr:DUF2190 family protein [Gemmatimonadota bacterium]